MSWSSFSENATAQTKDTSQIVLSVEIARQVAQDLIEGDEAKEEVVFLRECIGIQKEILSTQDSLIDVLDQQLMLESLNSQDLERQIDRDHLIQEHLQKQLKTTKGNVIVLGGTSIVLTGILATVLIKGLK